MKASQYFSFVCMSLLAIRLFTLGSELAAQTAATGPVSATGPTTATGPTLKKTAPADVPQGEELEKVRIDSRGLTAEEFVEKLLAAMTLEEKLGQLQQIYPGGETLLDADSQTISRGGTGSIFYVGHEDQIAAAQKVAIEESRLGIPLIVARDVIHGFRTVFPIPIGQASSWNPELVKRAAEVAASEARRVGIHWTFAPMVDISRDPRWGRIAESCGEDPVLASAMGAAMVEGFQSVDETGKLSGVAACPKHYVAYGLAEGGRDYNRVMVSRNELRNVYLKPFKSCVDAGAVTLMTAFNTINGVPATAHQYLLRDVLKKEWQFSGVVVTDWGTIKELENHGLVADPKMAALRAMQAGVDMEMVSTCYADNLEALLSEKNISPEMIDDAVRRILKIKVRLNLFEAPYADPQQPPLLSEEYSQIARELAQQSVVLLKNDEVLPLNRQTLKKVTVIGPYADAQQDQLGCWVMDSKPEDSVTPLVALREELGSQVEVEYVPCSQVRYGAAPDEINAAVAAAKAADIVLLFVGEDEAWSGEAHSRSDLSLTGSQTELVRALAKLDVPVVLTVMAGRPLTIAEEVDAVDAVLYAWQPGTMAGPALVDLLLGVVSPSGKLPVTFPKSVGQVPLYYNHPITGRPSVAGYRPSALQDVRLLPGDVRYGSHYIDSDPFPLFSFGFGLTYADFEYYDLKISRPSLKRGEGLEVTVRVANVGERAAVETVQLYTRDFVASVVRPVKELQAFRRVALEPGEVKLIEFDLAYESLGFFDEREQYSVEPGEFEVVVGGSSNTPLSAKFFVSEDLVAESSVAGDHAAKQLTPVSE